MKLKDKNTLKSYKPHIKKTLGLAIPIMCSQLGNAMVMLSDTIMVGRIGKDELAAVAFGNAIYIVGFVLLQGITFGSTPLIGKSYAAGKHKHATEQFANSLVVDSIACFIIGSLMWCVSFAMPYMGQDTAVWTYAIPYYKCLVASLIPYIVFLAFKQYMEGLGNTIYAMSITIACCTINVILNYIFIFGKFGLPEMGVFGAGLATFVSRMLMPIAYIVLFRSKSSLWRHFYFFKKKAIRWKDMRAISAIGIPIGSQMFIECSAFSLSAIMAGWFGSTALASHEIAMNISSLTFMVVTGIASAATISVSHQKGINNQLGVKKAGNAALLMAITYSSTCALTILAIRNFVPHMFTNDEEVIAMSAMLLILAAIYQIPDGLQAVTMGVLRGIADVKVPMYTCSFCYILLNLPFSYIVAVKMGIGITGIWWGFILGLSTLSAIVVIRWRKRSK